MPGRILVTPRSLTASPHPRVEKLRELGFENVYSAPGRQPDEAELLREPRTLALVGHPRVIATSHVGAFTEESVERATEMAVANLLDALASGGVA